MENIEPRNRRTKNKNTEIDKVVLIDRIPLTDKFVGKLVISLILFAGSGIVTHFVMKPLDISYVSLNELVDLEKNRLKKEGIADRNLFFGKPAEANGLIHKFQIKETGFRKIVLLSQGEVYGDTVKSVSKKAYDYVMENLK